MGCPAVPILQNPTKSCAFRFLQETFHAGWFGNFGAVRAFEMGSLHQVIVGLALIAFNFRDGGQCAGAAGLGFLECFAQA